MLKRRYKLLINFIRAVASLLMGSGHVPPSRVFFLLISVHLFHQKHAKTHVWKFKQSRNPKEIPGRVGEKNLSYAPFPNFLATPLDKHIHVNRAIEQETGHTSTYS